jgi:hypothetical protein
MGDDYFVCNSCKKTFGSLTWLTLHHEQFPKCNEQHSLVAKGMTARDDKKRPSSQSTVTTSLSSTTPKTTGTKGKNKRPKLLLSYKQFCALSPQTMDDLLMNDKNKHHYDNLFQKMHAERRKKEKNSHKNVATCKTPPPVPDIDFPTANDDEDDFSIDNNFVPQIVYKADEVSTFGENDTNDAAFELWGVDESLYQPHIDEEDLLQGTPEEDQGFSEGLNLQKDQEKKKRKESDLPGYNLQHRISMRQLIKK